MLIYCGTPNVYLGKYCQFCFPQKSLSEASQVQISLYIQRLVLFCTATVKKENNKMHASHGEVLRECDAFGQMTLSKMKETEYEVCGNISHY